MIAQPTRWWLYALAALSAGACGPDGCVKPVKQCPPGVKCISYDEYCDQSPQADWEMGKVCGLVAPEAQYPLNRAQRAGFCSQALGEKLDAGSVVFEPVAAYQCLQQKRSSCDPACRWQTVLGEVFPPGAAAGGECQAPCDHVFQGIRETGESCELSVECLEGLYCDVSHGCPGRCASQLRLGETVPRREACRSGSTVALRDGGLRCDELRAAGAGCERHDDELGPPHCVEGYTCAPQPPEASDGGADGGDDGGTDAGLDGGPDAGARPMVCVPWPDAGAVPDVDCSRVSCPWGQFCGGDSRCHLYSRPGSHDCAQVFGTLPMCIGGTQCVGDGGAGAGDCQPLSKAGEPCDPVAGIGTRSCDFESTCRGPTLCEVSPTLGCVCSPLASDGGICAQDQDCLWPLECSFDPVADGGRCGPPKTSCESAFERFCRANVACVDGGCVPLQCPQSP